MIERAASFSISNTMRFAWDAFQRRPWFLMWIATIVLAISAISSVAAEVARATGPQGELLGVLGDFIVQLFVGMGLVAVAVKAHDRLEELEVSDLWIPSAFWRYLGVTIIMAIGIAVGLLLFVIPGLIFITLFFLAPYFVIDRGSNPITAMKQSFNATKGSFLRLFGFILLLFLINTIGFLAVFIGLILTVPITLLATAHAYRQLSADVA